MTKKYPRSDYTIKVLDVLKILRMPRDTFTAWREADDQLLDGVKHPDFKVVSGLNFMYSAEAVAEAQKSLESVLKAKGEQDYYPKPAVEARQWTNADIYKHGRVNLLAMAMNASVTLSMRNSEKAFKIEKADDLTGKAVSARSILARNHSKLADGMRLEAAFNFPGVEFTVTETEYVKGGV